MKNYKKQMLYGVSLSFMMGVTLYAAPATAGAQATHAAASAPTAAPVTHAVAPAQASAPVAQKALAAPAVPWAVWGKTQQAAQTHLASQVKLAVGTVNMITGDIATMANPKDTLVALGIANRTYGGFKVGAPGSCAPLGVDVSALVTGLNQLNAAVKAQQAKMTPDLTAAVNKMTAVLNRLVAVAGSVSVSAPVAAPVAVAAPAVQPKK